MSTTTSAISCAFYMQGKCSFGDTCRFPHIKAPQAKAVSSRSTPKVDAVQQCKFYEKGHCTKGRNCPFSHIPSGRLVDGRTSLKPVMTSSIPVACHFFKQGTCRAGKSCPYSHVVEGVPKQPSIKGGSLDETYASTSYLKEVSKVQSPDALASHLVRDLWRH